MLSMVDIILPGPKPLISDVRRSGTSPVVVSAVDRFLDLDRSLAQGAILLPGFGDGGYWYAQYADIGSFDQRRNREHFVAKPTRAVTALWR